MRRIFLSLAVIGVMVLFSCAGVQAQSHPASQILPGTFGGGAGGAWTFPGSLTVNGANGLTLNDADITGADQIMGLNDLRLYGDSNGGPDIYISTGGNVGIGTATPGTSRLSVSGNVYVQGNIQATGTICNATACIGGGQGAVNAGAANKIAYYPAAGDRVDDFTGTSNGALYYDGSGVLRSATLPIASGGTGATSLTDLISLGAHTTGDYVATITDSATIGFLSGSGTGEGSTPTLSVVSDSINGAQLADSITLDGDLNVDSGTLYIDAANNRVGIGETSPDAKLHIDSGSAVGVRIESSIYGTSNLGGASNYITHSSGGAFYVRSYSGGSYTTRLVVDGQGRVGIGTTSLDDRLEIVGGNLDMNTNNIENVNRLDTAYIYALPGSNIVIRLS